MCSRDLWERDNNQTSLPPIPKSATSLQTQESQQRYPQDPCTPSTSSGKKSRFRFSEAERIKSIKELFNLLCEGDFATEEQLWKNLHFVLCYDSDRFKSCSLRLLKEHMLEQVVKYKKYDSEEATESGKERLHTEWGDAMRTLLTVWYNYESIVNLEAEKKTKKPGRPRKEATMKKNDDVAAAKAIREAALQTIENNSSFSENIIIELTDVDDSDNTDYGLHYINSNDAEFQDDTESTNNCPNAPRAKGVKRKHTTQAVKTRNSSTSQGNGVFLYLSDKTRVENELRKEELRLRERQHADTIKLQQDEIAYKKAKLEFEERKWQQQYEEKQSDNQRNDTIIKLLEAVLNSGVLKKNP
ncbi:hypothetical protein Zmor_005830 [Zophobas morio]|uniref:Uncharacterized protein n=1 Tax=Zophobas morio TaxID=2755281 RepID=A0AA38ISL6_9CUCU|nr:hypothetical protein Zmor_005830 [Zophobas morio]